MRTLLNVKSVIISWLILVDPFEFPQDEMLETMQAYTESHQKLPKSMDLESIVRDDYTLDDLLVAAQRYGLAGNMFIGAQRLCLVRLFIKYEEGFQ
jgi:hypothetical protein